MKKYFKHVIIGVLVFFLALGFAVSAGPVDEFAMRYLNFKANENIDNNDEVFGLAERSDTVVRKLLSYDDIVTTGVAVTNQVSGDFVVDNIIIETGTQDIASGTAFQIYESGGSYGTSTNVFSKLVVTMSRASTYDLFNSTDVASTTQRIILEDGAQLYARCTTADCQTSYDEAGDGDMLITVILKKVQTYSNIYE